jgi:hypothetical protein
VRRVQALIPIALALAALTLMLAACGGGDDGNGERNTDPAPSDAPSERATPPGPGGLPPALVQCYADKGYDIRSPADIHSAPPQVVQECFGVLHQGGGAPP